MASTDVKPKEWYEAFPEPSWDTPTVTAKELVELMKTKKAGVDYIVIDLRRTDFEIGFIRGAVNLPAHSLYPTLPTVVTLLRNIPKVIFHCQSCKAVSRGTRGAGWYKDALTKEGITTSQSLVLEGGIVGFLAAYKDDAELVVKLD
ncbi:hypothetical protein CALVIDRAFT_541675 [Calocera viscosa TUFC12733]|uniref:Rhodanese domain-containing protein n=1 Tax=Calocera viscosa (strain TUFC12733) TaxID=1330018 RepID=A0A167HHH6_CALVF|nr:hypothetical protein CALVIDRAFT_541675 [Calocera viscosa TUFC12733]